MTSEAINEYRAVTLSDPAGELEVTFLTSLGMVASSLRHHGTELLAARGGVEAYAASGSTFGIPLLHPWANRLSAWDYEVQGRHVELDQASPVSHRDGATGLPSHGLLAASRAWRVVDLDSSSVQAVLDFGADPDLFAGFPFPHLLTYRASVQDGAVTISLTVAPTGEVAVPIAFGFHPYLSLPDAARTSWELTLPVARRAVLSQIGIPTGETTELAPGQLDGPLADRAFDDCFDRLSGDPAVFVVADRLRRVEVTYVSGFDVAQIYSPAGADFICIEPMTAPVNALRSGDGLRFAQPGAEFTAVFRISVTRRS